MLWIALDLCTISRPLLLPLLRPCLCAFQKSSQSGAMCVLTITLSTEEFDQRRLCHGTIAWLSAAALLRYKSTVLEVGNVPQHCFSTLVSAIAACRGLLVRLIWAITSKHNSMLHNRLHCLISVCVAMQSHLAMLSRRFVGGTVYALATSHRIPGHRNGVLLRTTILPPPISAQ